MTTVKQVDGQAKEPPPRERKAKIGDVVKVGDRYALVVGFDEDVEHVSEKGEKTTETHPVVVDLPAAHRLELDHTVAE